MATTAIKNSLSNEKLKRIAILALCLFSIPLLGWLTSLYVENTWDSNFHVAVIKDGVLTETEFQARNISYMGVCSGDGALAHSPDAAQLCSGATEIQYSRLASIATAAIGAGLIILIFAGKKITGNNRKKLGAIFGPLVRIVMFILAVSVIAQAGILVYSLYTLEAAAIQRVHGGILLVIGIGAIFGSFQLLRHSFGLLKEVPSDLKAELLSRDVHPEMYELVQDIAKKLQADPPDHIIAGLEPTFFVTANSVKLLTTGKVIRGRTLFVSLSLMHLLTREELVSVIGHELGHFKGQDTEYSMTFAPIYTKLSNALGTMSSGEGASAFALFPAMAVLGVCLGQFSEVERTIGRERELVADQAGAEAGSAIALASALIKVSLYASYWVGLTRHHIDELVEGRYYENLAETYVDVCRNGFNVLNWEEAKLSFAEYVQPHPIDTHPPLAMRLQALGISLADKDATIAAPADEPISNSISDDHEIEQRLTILEIQWLQAIGAVILPKSN